jgi:hypothetical protein
MDRINQWLTFISNIAVLVGVLFVAYELKQSREFAEAETRARVGADTVEFFLRMAENPDLAQAIRKYDAGEDLTPEESATVGYLTFAQVRRWETTWKQYEAGLLSEAEIQQRLGAWRDEARLPRFKRALSRSGFDPEFMEQLND